MELPNLSRQQYLIIGGGALILMLLYRFYSSRSGGGTDPESMAPSDPGYSDLAGQLQAQGAALGNQEQSDVNALAGDITGLTGQIGSLTSAYGGLSDQIGGLNNRFDDLDIPAPVDVSGITEQVNALAAGQIKANRSVAAAVEKANKAAWDANPRHTISYAQHKKNLDAKHTTGSSSHGTGQNGSVAPSTHSKKPHVKAKPKTKKVTQDSGHNTPKGGTKPPTRTHAQPKPKPKPKKKTKAHH